MSCYAVLLRGENDNLVHIRRKSDDALLHSARVAKKLGMVGLYSKAWDNLDIFDLNQREYIHQEWGMEGMG